MSEYTLEVTFYMGYVDKSPTHIFKNEHIENLKEKHQQMMIKMKEDMALYGHMECLADLKNAQGKIIETFDTTDTTLVGKWDWNIE